MNRICLLMMVSVLLWHCGPTPQSTGPQWVKLNADQMPAFKDNDSPQAMVRAINRQLEWLAGPGADKSWSFGEETVSAKRMISTLTVFREHWLHSGSDSNTLREKILLDFDVYRIQWNQSPDFLITGYHAPVLEGSLTRTERFKYPLYRIPDDAFFIRPAKFRESLMRPGTSPRHNKAMARIDPQTNEATPYFTREEIDGQGVLQGKGLELVWLDDYFESFLFHVQGGGFVQLQDGSYVKLNYAGKNDHPYISIGRLLVDEGKIPEADISIQAIKKYFAANPNEVTRVCYANKSYVFYQLSGSGSSEITPDLYPHGVLDFPVTPRRSIATDKAWFPGGALMFIEGQQRIESGQPQAFSLFAIDQDTGGAITENHIDLFQGAGPQAETDAGLLKDHQGKVYMLLIKENRS